MKQFFIAAPIALLLGSAVTAQTATDGTATDGATPITNEADTGEMSYGTGWSESIGTTFFTDSERQTLRSQEEITQGWQSLSQEDRDMVTAECDRFSAETNAGGNMDTTTEGAATTDTTTDTATGTAATDTATTTEGSGAEGTATAAAGYDLNAMMAICPAIQDL